MFFIHRWSHFFRADSEAIIIGKGYYLMTRCRWCKKIPLQELEYKLPSDEELRIARLARAPFENLPD
jgi:hypothetical protein